MILKKHWSCSYFMNFLKWFYYVLIWSCISSFIVCLFMIIFYVLLHSPNTWYIPCTNKYFFLHIFTNLVSDVPSLLSMGSVQFSRYWRLVSPHVPRNKHFISYCFTFLYCMWFKGYFPITHKVLDGFTTMLDFLLCFFLSNSWWHKTFFCTYEILLYCMIYEKWIV